MVQLGASTYLYVCMCVCVSGGEEAHTYLEEEVGGWARSLSDKNP